MNSESPDHFLKKKPFNFLALSSFGALRRWAAPSKRGGSAEERLRRGAAQPLLRELSATLSSKLYQFFLNEVHTHAKKNQPKEFHGKTSSSQNNFIQKQFHPKAVSSKSSFIKKQFHQKAVSSKGSFIQKHIVNVQPNALPWTGLAPDPPCPDHPKFRAFFPLPTFSSYLTFNIMRLFVDLCWWFRRLHFLKDQRKPHIWAFWTPNFGCVALIFERKTPKPPTQVQEKPHHVEN